MPWVLRGLRDGIVTSRYPARPDGYGPGFKGAVEVWPTQPARDLLPDATPVTQPPPAGDAAQSDPAPLAGLCPAGAILDGPAGPRVDRGRCILCGRCVAARPDLFAFSPGVETSTLRRSALIVPGVPEDDEALALLREDLGRRVKALRRSIHVRHVDAGSDGSEEWEVAALTNPIYDVQRLGVYFTATPRHADVLLVTGVGTAGMKGPLRATYEAMPDPRVVVAAGADATGGGLVHPTYATSAGVAGIVPVDVWVPGSPPSPFSLLHGILLGIGLLPPLPPGGWSPGPGAGLSAESPSRPSHPSHQRRRR